MNKKLYIRMNSSLSYEITVEPNDIGYTIENLWDDIQSAINHNVPYFDITAGDGIVILAFHSLKLSKVLIHFDNVQSIELRGAENDPRLTSKFDRESVEKTKGKRMYVVKLVQHHTFGW